METKSNSGPVIYSIGASNSDDPNINKLIQERIKELLDKFKDTHGIIYLNIEKVLLGNVRSRSRSRSSSRSRSRSNSHSRHYKGKTHHKHHLKVRRSPQPFGHRRHHYPHHHSHHRHGHHGFPHHYYTSETEETNCEATTGPETNEEYNHMEVCCRRRGRGHHRRDRGHSRSRSRGRKSRSKSNNKKTPRGRCNKDTSEVQDVIVIDQDNSKSSTREEDLEKRFDNMNVSQT